MCPLQERRRRKNGVWDSIAMYVLMAIAVWLVGMLIEYAFYLQNIAS